jgi:hypothetical protein
MSDMRVCVSGAVRIEPPNGSTMSVTVGTAKVCNFATMALAFRREPLAPSTAQEAH